MQFKYFEVILDIAPRVKFCLFFIQNKPWMFLYVFSYDLNHNQWTTLGKLRPTFRSMPPIFKALQRSDSHPVKSGRFYINLNFLFGICIIKIHNNKKKTFRRHLSDLDSIMKFVFFSIYVFFEHWNGTECMKLFVPRGYFISFPDRTTHITLSSQSATQPFTLCVIWYPSKELKTKQTRR